MGDIINSRSLAPEVREKVTQAAKNTFDRINTKYRGSFLADFGLVRGDSFEGVLLSPYYAPQIMMDIVKAFYNVEKTLVRISAVMGQLTITSSDRNEVDGPVFENVMGALAELKERESTHWMQISFDIGTLGQSLINSQIELITTLTERWTDKQREICWVAEEIEEQEAYPKDTAKKQDLYKLVANKLGSTSAVIKKQLNAASYDVYRQGWDGIRAFLVEIDEYAVTDISLTQKSYLSYLNVGQRKQDQHNDSEAIPLLKEALDTAKNELGNDDIQLIQIYARLAESYTRMSIYREAENAINEALKLLDTIPKSVQHIDILDTQAALFLSKGDLNNAKIKAEEAISNAHDILNATHRQWGGLFNTLAVILYEMSEYDDALKYYEKSSSFEYGVIDNAIQLNNIAWCYLSLQKYDDAICKATEALYAYESNLPPDHTYIANTRILIETIEKAQKGEQK